MTRFVLAVSWCALAWPAMAEQPSVQLPQSNYHPQASDPAWLTQATQFHGHLGPAAIAGVRMGIAGLRAVDAKGYFDVEVTCEGPFAKPPQSCFLDGVQVGTGATLGKRTLHWVPADKIVLRIKHLQTGKTADVYPTAALLALIASFKPQAIVERADHGNDHSGADEHLETIARKIASLPDKEIVRVETHEASRGER